MMTQSTLDVDKVKAELAETFAKNKPPLDLLSRMIVDLNRIANSLEAIASRMDRVTP